MEDKAGGLEDPLTLSDSGCWVKICQKVPVSTTYKKTLFGGRENKEKQNQGKNLLLGPFRFVFKKTDCAGK